MKIKIINHVENPQIKYKFVSKIQHIYEYLLNKEFGETYGLKCQHDDNYPAYYIRAEKRSKSILIIIKE